jgi:RNA polymerase sigma-70 factor (ECF subfamily)
MHRSRSHFDSEQLLQFASRAETAWPGLGVDRSAFIDWIAAHLAQIGHRTLAMSHATDLLLAFGCIRGDPASLRAFDARVLAQVDIHIARFEPGAAFADEVRQQLRARLLSANGGDEPRLAGYRGHGPLSAWVRSIAIRTALNCARAHHKRATLREDTVDGIDAEMQYVRATYAREFRASLVAVVGSSRPTDLDILRMHYVEDRRIEDVGASLGLHRATIARRLARIREAVLRETSERLHADSGLDADEVAFLLGNASREMEVSLTRMLAEST